MIPKIPLVDLNAQYRSIKAEIDAAISDVISRSAFIRSIDVDAFEQEFAVFCEAEACAAVGNGTDALYLALRSLGIGPGDEVHSVRGATGSNRYPSRYYAARPGAVGDGHHTADKGNSPGAFIWPGLRYGRHPQSGASAWTQGH